MGIYLALSRRLPLEIVSFIEPLSFLCSLIIC